MQDKDKFSEENIKDPDFWSNLLKITFKKKWNQYQNYISKYEIKEEEIPLIRKKIFEDDEFLKLSQQIIQHGSEKRKVKIQGSQKKVYNFQNFFSNEIFLSETYEMNQLFLKVILSKKNTIIQHLLDNLFLLLSKKFNFFSCAVLVSDKYSTFYKIVYSYNLDLQTQKNFYVNINDIFFSYEGDNQFYELEIKSNLRENLFFKKRFSKEFMDRINVIFYFPFELENFNFMILFFYDSTKPQVSLWEDFTKSLLFIFHEIGFLFIRKVSSLDNQKELYSKRYLFSLVYHIIAKEIKKNKEIFLKKIKFKKPIYDYYLFNEFLKKIKKELIKHEEILILRARYAEIVFICKNYQSYRKFIDNLVIKLRMNNEFTFEEEDYLFSHRKPLSILFI